MYIIMCNIAFKVDLPRSVLTNQLGKDTLEGFSMSDVHLGQRQLSMITVFHIV